MPANRYRDVVVLGASAGGAKTLSELVSGLPGELPASLFVVQHVAPSSPSLLAEILNRAGKLPAKFATDSETIERGQIYVAPPDHHLLLTDGHVSLSRGPRENGHRPAVDPLFRSAARHYGPRVIAAVVSGNLDDGTAGLIAVKSRGGIAIVQDPEDALYSGMPDNAIAADHPDYIVPASELADLICWLLEERLEPDRALVPSFDEEDLEMSEDAAFPDGAVPIPLTCPECSGPLFERRTGGGSTFQCLVGHRYSAASLDAEQAGGLEAVLWHAVRGLRERAELLHRIAGQPQAASSRLAQRYEARARACEEQADAIVVAIERLGATTDQEARATA